MSRTPRNLCHQLKSYSEYTLHDILPVCRVPAVYTSKCSLWSSGHSINRHETCSVISRTIGDFWSGSWNRHYRNLYEKRSGLCNGVQRGTIQRSLHDVEMLHSEIKNVDSTPKHTNSSYNATNRRSKQKPPDGLVEVCSFHQINTKEFQERKQKISRTELAQSLNIHSRDIRLIDPTLQTTNPVVLVRPNALLLRLGYISCVIKAKEAWFLKPDEAVRRVVSKLRENHVPQSSINNINEVRGGRFRKHHVSNSRNNDFEFRCFDLCMQVALDAYEEIVRSIALGIDYVLGSLTQTRTRKRQFELFDLGSLSILVCRYSSDGLPSIETLVALMGLKNDVQATEVLLMSLRSSLLGILNDDEDMTAMFLSRPLAVRKRLEQHKEVEIMLETHMQRVEELCSDLSTLKQSIDHHEELMKLKLDVKRNEIMHLSLQVALVTLTCTIATVGAGLFGMNIQSGLEESQKAFWIIASAIFCFSFSGVLVQPSIAMKLFKLATNNRRPGVIVQRPFS